MIHTREKIWPKYLLIDRAVKDSELTCRIAERWTHGSVEIIDDPQQVVQKINAGPQPQTKGKRYLLLTRYAGRFIKPCQGIVDTAVCCNYTVIDLAQNCNLDCTYCILQAYLNNPLMVQYVNIADLLQEIDDLLTANPGKPFRFGTGELTDSLALDPLTGLSRFIVKQFAPYRNVVFEFKTKTNHVEHLLDIEAPSNIIISWSMNTPEMIRREELKTASLDQRIEAAHRCQKHGYQIGLHFDPLIHYENWEDDYRDTVRRIFERIDPAARIAWISLGAFRFPGRMKGIIRRRFPGSLITTGEFVPGPDGKMRYFQPIRVEMYSRMIEWLHEFSPNLQIYLCMESPEVWRQVMVSPPRINDELAELLDRSCGCQKFMHTKETSV